MNINPDNPREKVRVSVIIPIYNVEQYIGKCLESLAQQTLRPKDFEVILIDDQSEDEGYKIAKEFSKDRPNFYVYKNNKNIGPGPTRNFALKKAKGEYIYFLDSDDYIDPTTLEVLLMTAYDNQADIVSSGFRRVDEEGNILAESNDMASMPLRKLNIVQNAISLKINPMNCSKLIRRSLFREHDLWFSAGWHEDVAMTIKLYFWAKNIVNHSDYFYYWVKHTDSITARVSKEHIDGFIDGVSEPLDYILDNAGAGFKRKILGHYQNGLKVASDKLLRRIIGYKSEDIESQRELLLYLFEKINAQSEGRESIIFGSNENTLVYKFYKAFDENKDSNKATIVFLESMQPKDSIKATVRKEETLTLRKKVVNILKEIKPLYKILKFIWKIAKQPGGIKGKYEYIKFRIKNYINKRRGVEKIIPEETKLSSKKISKQILIFCEANYHIRNGAVIVRALRKDGFDAAIVDLTKFLVGGKRQLDPEELENYTDITFYDYNEQIYSEIDLKSLKCAIYFNDWGIHHKKIRELRSKNIKTIGIDEGVNDFLKLGEGFTYKISPYRTCEHVILPGEFECQFFEDRPGQYHVAGLPMIKNLYKEEVVFPEKPMAIINVNFSYGVLTHARDEFVRTAVQGCEKAGIDYVISQHPMDTGDMSMYKQTDKSMYDAIREGSIFISRFSGAIIESLALGKPSIYHNPHEEKIRKFQEPLGAYGISNDSDSLAQAIKEELDKAKDNKVREYSKKFMEYHVNISDKVEPAERIKEIITQIIGN